MGDRTDAILAWAGRDFAVVERLDAKSDDGKCKVGSVGDAEGGAGDGD